MKEKLELLMKALDEQGLSSSQWEKWLDNASETLWAARQVLEKFEPYATSTIYELKESEDYLVILKSELNGSL